MGDYFEQLKQNRVWHQTSALEVLGENIWILLD